MIALGEVDVLVIGRSCVDYLIVVSRLPKENSKIQLSCRLVEGGGQGGTSSCCIAHLGGHVVYVGRIGDDEEGDFCMKQLEAHGVSTTYVEQVSGGVTPVAYILINERSGTRTIVYEPNHLPPLAFDERLRSLVTSSKVILLDPEVTYLASSFREQREKLGAIVYDGERYRKGIREMMQSADYFIPSADFLHEQELSLKGSLKERMFGLQELISGVLVVTAGERGAYLLKNGILYHFSPFAVTVRDTTGAGDNFHAAFAFTLSRGMDLIESVKFSVAVASLSCREYGGRKGIPTFEEAREASELVGVDIF